MEHDPELKEYGVVVPRRKALWIEVGIVLWAFAILGFLVALIYPPPIWWLYDARLEATLTMALFSSGEIALLLFIVWMSGDELSCFGFQRPSKAQDLAILLAILTVFVSIYTVATQVSSSGTGERPEYLKEMFGSYSLLEYACLGLSLLLSAFFEELLFRGYLITRLEELSNGRSLPIYAAAAAFGIVHLYQGLLGVMYASIMGLAFGYLFSKYRTIWPLALAHAAINFFIIAWSLL